MITVRDTTGTVLETWDDTAGIYTDHRTTPPTTRLYTYAELADAATRTAAEATATVRTLDTSKALDLLDRLTDDLGTPTDTWPTTKSWRALNQLKAADITTVAALWAVVRWMIPASLRTVRATRKALRQINALTAPDTDTD